MALTEFQFAAVYRRHVQRIYRICFHFTGRAADAEDLTQDTFMCLIEKEPEFHSEEHEKAWLITCAKNLCRDFLRHKENSNLPLQEYDLPYHPEIPGFSEIASILAELSPEDRTLVYLFYVEGYKGRELARIMGMKEATLRSRLLRARARLKDHMEEIGHVFCI